MLNPTRVDLIRQRIADLPTGTWIKCTGCGGGIYRPRLRKHSATCPECGYHFPLSAGERIDLLADPGTFTEHDRDLRAVDPLEFRDSKAYPDRVAEAVRNTGQQDAARWGVARINGMPAVITALDFGFMGGSMGSVVGEKVSRAAEHALRTHTPLIVCSASGGARMQEGIFSLLQMAKTSAALRRLADAGVPYFSVLCDPVYGGVSASFASLGDVVIAERGARAGFAGPTVIEQTIRQKLPTGFQTAEFLLANGHIDLVVARAELRLTLARILRWHTSFAEPAPAETIPAAATETRSAWDTVQHARDPKRPHLGEYIAGVFEDFVELRGDRSKEDDPSVVGGLALLDGSAVVVVGHRKGRGTKEGIARNFGMPHPSGYRKAARLMRYAERFGMPLVTFIDTPGAYPGIRAEQENQSGAIADNLALLAGLATPIVSIVVGEGGSGGALALGVGDRLLMLSNTTYSVISPEGCASILFRDASRAPEAAAALRLTATELHANGVADRIVPEPPGGAQCDHAATTDAVKNALREELSELRQIPVRDLLDRRYRKLRAAGRFAQGSTDITERQ
ncbi:acetyl-CoA carboxylase carboxyltransferase subunit alpha [Actinokineospora sp.]|uniref:acetyl-CoA carboxylase carboxyltransferase subunit alpha n=1 Tax=Actinokineospora sp. TaxID=1872133 RepID=UPI0040378F82